MLSSDWTNVPELDWSGAAGPRVGCEIKTGMEHYTRHCLTSLDIASPPTLGQLFGI